MDAHRGQRFHALVPPVGPALIVFASIGSVDAPLPSAQALLRQAALSEDLAWALDPELSAVSRPLARKALSRPPTPAAVEHSVRGRGLGDPIILPAVLTGVRPGRPDDDASRSLLRKVLRGFAAELQAEPETVRIGGAWARSGSAWALVVLVAHRTVDWSIETAGRRVVFSGRFLRRASRLQVMSLGPCAAPTRCAHPIALRDVDPRGRSIGFTLDRPPGSGRWVVEAVDPEKKSNPVVGWWFFDEGPVRFMTWPGEPAAWLARLRKETGQPSLVIDPDLVAAAHLHARQTCGEGRASHRSPDDSLPEDRAAATGYRGFVSENVAVSTSSRRAFRNLLWSPSHRRVMLDSTLDSAGTAVHVHDRDRVCLVQMFGRRPVAERQGR